jgi:hypothetical protein
MQNKASNHHHHPACGAQFLHASFSCLIKTWLHDQTCLQAPLENGYYRSMQGLLLEARLIAANAQLHSLKHSLCLCSTYYGRHNATWQCIDALHAGQYFNTQLVLLHSSNLACRLGWRTAIIAACRAYCMMPGSSPPMQQHSTALTPTLLRKLSSWRRTLLLLLSKQQQ